MISESQPNPVEAPSATPITITLPLGAWHRIVAILRRAPPEDVHDLLPDILAKGDPQILAAARAYARHSKPVSHLIPSPSSRLS